jgi:phosphomannomutase
MFTASHNPAQYNGIKMCRTNASPIGLESGLAEIRDRALAAGTEPSTGRGSITEHDVLDAYAAHLLSLAPVQGRRLQPPLKVAVDAGNGMAGHTAPAVFGRLGDTVELVPLYFELDGTFPHHEANPLKEENLHDLMHAVKEHHADLGVAFDGDADRAAFVDEHGVPVGSDLMTALIGGELLEREPGKAVLYDLRSSRAVHEYIEEKGGIPVRERVGHSFMKATLRKRDGIFGGELAGHYYFRDHYYADCSLMAVVEVLNMLRKRGQPLSMLVNPLKRYAKSPEINFVVEDKDGMIRQLAERFSDAEIDYLDGITLRYKTWWANVRPSNTEPFLRLVLEASTHDELEKRKHLLFGMLGEPAE